MTFSFRKARHWLSSAILASFLMIGCLAQAQTPLQPQVQAVLVPKVLQYRILEDKPHDQRLFTQGLLTQGDVLVETSGGYSQSLIRRYNANSGARLNQAELPEEVFAEGVAQVNDELYVLTWREGLCFVLDTQTLERRKTHGYEGEGWGLVYDGKQLIMSDGSHKLWLRDPADFSVVGMLAVTGAGQQWHKLNELEYARGMIWSNVWQDNRILAIHPDNGNVLGILDLTELAAINSTSPGQSVLNGIAYDAERQAFWVTGKLWPRRYLLEIVWPKS